MSKFRKKPIEVEAMQLRDGGDSEVLFWMGSHHEPNTARRALAIGGGRLLIRTMEGDLTANIGDWIIRGVQGEFYPCKPDVFAATYDPVSS